MTSKKLTPLHGGDTYTPDSVFILHSPPCEVFAPFPPGSKTVITPNAVYAVRITVVPYPANMAFRLWDDGGYGEWGL
jgi:hypothetical protein